MLSAHQRSVVGGPAFIRLLARLTNTNVRPPDPALPDRLSQWLDWKHALALSTALDGGSPTHWGAGSNTAQVDEDECKRMRMLQVEAIVAATTHSGDGCRGVDKVASGSGGEHNTVEFAVFGQRYRSRQRAMQSVTGDLRGRLRDRLGAQSKPMARLAEVDAAMELALSPREQTLLASVPVVLEGYFERLRQAGLADTSTAADTWLDVFCKNMRSILLAELDVRFQPVEGLLAALRAC